MDFLFNPKMYKSTKNRSLLIPKDYNRHISLMIRRIPIGVIQQNTVKFECFLREMEKLSIQREGT